MQHSRHEYSSNRSGFIQQFVEQQKTYLGACFNLTGEKGYRSVGSGSRHHFIKGLVIHLDDKAVQTEITKGQHTQALAPLHQYPGCIGV